SSLLLKLSLNLSKLSSFCFLTDLNVLQSFIHLRNALRINLFLLIFEFFYFPIELIDLRLHFFNLRNKISDKTLGIFHLLGYSIHSSFTVNLIGSFYTGRRKKKNCENRHKFRHKNTPLNLQMHS